MNSFNEIEAKFRGMAPYELLIMGVLGVAVLLFGYRIKKIAFFIIWFLIGYNIMMFLMPVINNAVPQIAGDPLYQNLIPIGGGVILAFLGFTIEKLCVAGICFFLIMMITIQYFGTDVPTLVIGAILGAVAAASATTVMKPAIIVATSLAGAYAITLVLLILFPQISKEIFYFPMLIGFAVLGSICQFTTSKNVD